MTSPSTGKVKQNYSKDLGIQQGSILLDLKHFYDTVCRQKLLEAGRKHGFPPMLLHHAMVVHGGPRFLCAEGQSSQAVHTERSIIAGCPFSVALAKLYLWETCSLVYCIHPSLRVCSWVDDISVDVIGRSPRQVADRMVKVFQTLQASLKEAKLQLSPNKSGIVVNTRELKHCLQQVANKVPQV